MNNKNFTILIYLNTHYRIKLLLFDYHQESQKWRNNNASNYSISLLSLNTPHSPSSHKGKWASARCKTLIKSTYSFKEMKGTNRPKSSRKWAVKGARHFQSHILLFLMCSSKKEQGR